jgi:hypothetical protein
LSRCMGRTRRAADLPGSGIHPVADQPAVDRAILNGYRRYDASCSHCHVMAWAARSRRL